MVTPVGCAPTLVARPSLGEQRNRDGWKALEVEEAGGGVATAAAMSLVQGKITAQVLTSVSAGVGGIDTILSWCKP